MLNVYLGLLIGLSVFAAVNHLAVGLRGARRDMHAVLGVFALAISFYLLTSFVMLRADAVDVYRVGARAQGLAAALVVLGALWFASTVLGGLRRGVVLGLSAVLGALGVTSLLMPAGIFYGAITGLREVDTGWLGTVTLPEATANPYETVFNLVVYLPFAFIIYRLLQLFLQGRRQLVLVSALAFVIPMVPALIDTFFLGVDTFAFPATETGLALSLVFLSAVISEDVARTAGLRDRLAQSEDRYRWLVRSAPEAICVYDVGTGRFTMVNPRAESLFGLDSAALTSLDARSLLGSIETRPDSPGVLYLVDQAAAGARPTVECTVAATGTAVPCELRLSSLPSPGGQLVRVGLQDITDRKAAEVEQAAIAARIRRSEKLQTIGTLAEGIAHDFNNVLTPIVGFGELAADRVDPGHPAAAYITEMRESGDRARELVGQILTFTKHQEPRQTVFQIEPVVRQALRFLRAALPPGIRLEPVLDAPGVRIKGAGSQVHQIIMNLGLNAAHAMAEGGCVTVALGLDGDVVELSVSDTGVGMDAGTVARIYDPFFTTKDPGRGTGLGLSMVRGVVESWAGRIDVESALGEGTTFRIRLPMATEDDAAPDAAALLRTGGELVLLVDDDMGVLEAVRRMLASLGYRVVAHNEPAAALRSLDPDALDLCITDFDMPRMNGVAFADRVRQAFPGLPVVLITGSAEGLERRPASPGPWVALPKPFSRTELSAAIRAALEPA